MDRQPPVVQPVNEGPDTLRMDEMGEIDGMVEIRPGCHRRDLPASEGTPLPNFNPVSGFPTSWTGHLLLKEEPW